MNRILILIQFLWCTNICLGQISFEHFTVYDTAIDTSRFIDNFEYVRCVDLDNDKFVDVVAASTGPIGKYCNLWWFKNLGTGNSFSPPQNIFQAEGEKHLPFIDIGDIDNDGDMDILYTSSEENTRILWFENIDSADSFLLHELTDMYYERCAVLKDMDQDGDLDVLCSGTQHTEWYSNNGNGEFMFETRFYEYFDGSRHMISGEDFDGDSDLDVLYWRGNNGNWKTDELILHNNIDGNATFGEAKVLSRDNPVEIRDVDLIDINRDGQKDVVFCSGSEFNSKSGLISWSEVNSDLSLGNRQTIASTVDGVTYLEAVDLDNDNDLDLVSSAPNNPIEHVRPEQNGEYIIILNNGANAFSEPTRVLLEKGALRNVTTADIDNDGEPELIGSAYNGIFGLDLDIISSAKNEISSNEDLFKIYPNPVSGVLNLENPIGEYEIISLSGNIILKSADQRVEVSHWTPGLYYLRINSRSGIFLKPFLKQ